MDKEKHLDGLGRVLRNCNFTWVQIWIKLSHELDSLYPLCFGQGVTQIIGPLLCLLLRLNNIAWIYSGD